MWLVLLLGQDWISDLGDDSIRVRDSAFARLVEMGEAALPSLLKASKESDDPEVRERAKSAMRAIQWQLSERDIHPSAQRLESHVPSIRIYREPRALAALARDGTIIRIRRSEDGAIESGLFGAMAALQSDEFNELSKAASLDGGYTPPATRNR